MCAPTKILPFFLSFPDGTYNEDGNDAFDQREPDLLPKWETIDLQDYRNRYASYNHDESVQNLRRRVPLMAIWDDHELSNNASGDINNLGFMGNFQHQPICLAAGDFFPKSWQSFLKCDRNEGGLLERYKAAAQAFWEYQPIRHVPGSMGQIRLGTLTKIMEWGSLTTVAGFDTRLSYRNFAHPQQTGTSLKNWRDKSCCGKAKILLNRSKYLCLLKLFTVLPI